MDPTDTASERNLRSQYLAQLHSFVQYERKQRPGITHIAEWALGELDRLTAEVKRLTAALEAERADAVKLLRTFLDEHPDATFLQAILLLAPSDSPTTGDVEWAQSRALRKEKP